MLSNQKHINRSNYEEFFLLYVDNELSAEERNEVEAFVILHPDLQDELEMLKGTQLNPETFSFDKSALFADKMKQNSMEESLLLYIDDELSESKKKELEAELSTNSNLNKEYSLLKQTKLDKNETIVYPNKKELYRHKVRSIRPVFILRIAAAVVILLFAGILFWNSNNSSVTPPTADITIKEGKTDNVVAKTGTTPTEDDNANDERKNKDEQNDQLKTTNPLYNPANRKQADNLAKVEEKVNEIRQQETQQPVQQIAHADVVRNIPDADIKPLEVVTPQQPFNTEVVTSENPAAYINTVAQM